MGWVLSILHKDNYAKLFSILYCCSFLKKLCLFAVGNKLMSAQSSFTYKKFMKQTAWILKLVAAFCNEATNTNKAEEDTTTISSQPQISSYGFMVYGVLKGLLS